MTHKFVGIYLYQCFPCRYTLMQILMRTFHYRSLLRTILALQSWLKYTMKLILYMVNTFKMNITNAYPYRYELFLNFYNVKVWTYFGFFICVLGIIPIELSIQFIFKLHQILPRQPCQVRKSDVQHLHQELEWSRVCINLCRSGKTSSAPVQTTFSCVRYALFIAASSWILCLASLTLTHSINSWILCLTSSTFMHFPRYRFIPSSCFTVHWTLHLEGKGNRSKNKFIRDQSGAGACVWGKYKGCFFVHVWNAFDPSYIPKNISWTMQQPAVSRVFLTANK